MVVAGFTPAVVTFIFDPLHVTSIGLAVVPAADNIPLKNLTTRFIAEACELHEDSIFAMHQAAIIFFYRSVFEYRRERRAVIAEINSGNWCHALCALVPRPKFYLL